MTVGVQDRVAIASEIVVVEEHGTVYVVAPLSPPVRLNRVGSAIWRLVDGASTVDDVAQRFAARYGNGDDATATVVPFVDRLVGAGFLCLVSP